MIQNVYEDDKRAASYARLDFPGTYYLAYRDLPEILKKHTKGSSALDFGCGTGRSTRFLHQLNFNALGIDISRDMIQKACELDPKGDYKLIGNADFDQLEKHSFDLILSVFTFDNIPTFEDKFMNMKGLGSLLKQGGRLINLVSSPEIYKHEWASFSTRDFPENKTAKAGDIVKIIMTDVDDRRPVEDVIWPHENYVEVYEKAGLEIEKMYQPLGKETEPFQWVNETKIAPWVIYVLRKRQKIKKSDILRYCNKT